MCVRLLASLQASTENFNIWKLFLRLNKIYYIDQINRDKMGKIWLKRERK
jgi:hypothetical protein